MATAFTCFRPTPILSSSASSNHRKPDPNRRKPSSSNWWTPLFGWPSDPDYINNPNTNTTNNNNNNNNERKKNNDEPVSDFSEAAESEIGGSRSRFTLGSFTEEKAKQLRKKTVETAAFHDIMYHSAIASRLASDVSGRYDI